MKFFFLSCLFWMSCCLIPAMAQSAPFRFEHITVNEGLSHSDAMCVAQDRLGFTWVGTNKGLDRYDGHTLKTYDLPLNDRLGTTANRVRTLHVDPSGRLWVGVERAGLYLYNASKDRFSSIQECAGAAAFQALAQQLSEVNINAITSDAPHRLWIATHQAGLFVVELAPSGSIQKIAQIPIFGQPSISRLAVDRTGQVWVGTLNHGLWVIKPHSRTALQVQALGQTPIRALHRDYRGDLWIGTGNQVFWAPNATLAQAGQLQPQALPLQFATIESLFLDSFQRLWIGTSYGLMLMRPAQRNGLPLDVTDVQTFLPQDTDLRSINSVRVHDILEDRFNNLWLATSAGGLNLLKLRSKPFGLIRRQMLGSTTPAHNYINTIFKDEKAQQIWMGTRNGFASYDLRQKTFKNYLSSTVFGRDNGMDVSAIYQDTQGTLWIGTRYKGLLRMAPGGSSPPRLQAPVPNGPDWRNICIEHITQDRHGMLWVATSSAGILAYDEQGKYRGTYSPDQRNLPTRQITSLLYDASQDCLWASTRDQGVLKLQIRQGKLSLLKAFTHQPGNPNSLQTNYAWPLAKDSAGNLWIGTIGGGLHRLTPGTERIERYRRWVPENDIESLQFDESGNLWIGGTGLYQFTPRTRQLWHYDVTDGLQSNSFKVGASYRSSDGTLYFGGINGITSFKPAAIRPNPYPPLVQITEFRVHNQPVATGDTLNGRVLLEKPFSANPDVRLEASENDFSLAFVALNYANPKKQRYAYRLAGYNTNWVELPSGQRMASFSNLAAGTYTFLVKATNGDGIWSSQSAQMQVTILPPWWKSWWAYVLYGCILTGALLLYRRIATAQQALKNTLAFEKFQHEKEKELTDLKLSFFTNVSHELRTPLTLILGPMEELVSSKYQQSGLREKVLLMHSQTRKLLDLVNQLLDFRKVESGHLSLKASRENISSFVEELYLIYQLKAEEMQLDYRLEKPAEPIYLYFDRNKLEIILTNLLSNAFKYTRPQDRIRLSLQVVGDAGQSAEYQNGRLLQHYLEIQVRDWGVGMPTEELEHIFDPYFQASHTQTLKIVGSGIGLSLVKQWVERHRGEVSVTSAPDQGTTFTVRLPFGNRHLQASEIHVPETSVPATLELPEADAELLAATSQLPVSLRVLVVEDNEEVRKYLHQLLVGEFEVLTAVDGLDGWNQALASLPDLIISDIMMPRSDGLELCRKIKQHPKTNHIPVLLLTARAAAVYELEGLEHGADDYIAKPFHPKILYAKITSILLNRVKLREYYQRKILLEPSEVVIPDADKFFLEKAMQIVESQLQEPEFNVQILVQEMGMSQSVFYRRLKSITGQTVVEFIRDVRMKRAAQLLASTPMRVSDIAYQVGIEDVKYFRKMFQKLYNVPPSEYARQFRTTTTPLEEDYS
ncbi:hybrid sensor histidine kinase/response regulator [Siphonobacter sp. BAB-5405]|uniref:hybrid sensor histidine kinase/response regulator transcription factor n=1 Tax=Siphonobacter sp. BAB-5405 TaxID=1864825 RepID=UPI000C808FF1|nr:two-component regulator propeller domain-containing protein [Siphonobacter sp. BAB-5405]PMD92435.1 hybrid sensor histidine kinase/response regulator [Siphonobacter sp. BAB-5405]